MNFPFSFYFILFLLFNSHHNVYAELDCSGTVVQFACSNDLLAKKNLIVSSCFDNALYATITFLNSTINQLSASVDISDVGLTNFVPCDNTSKQLTYNTSGAYLFIHQTPGVAFIPEQVKEFMTFIKPLDVINQIGFPSLKYATMLRAGFGMASLFQYTYPQDAEDFCVDVTDFPFLDKQFDYLYYSTDTNNPLRAPYTTPAIYQSDTKRTYITLGMPIYKGSYYGTITAELDITELVRVFSESKPALTGSYLLITSGGLAIAGRDELFPIVYGVGQTKETVIKEQVLLQSVTTPFSSITLAIAKGSTSTTINFNNIQYYVHIGSSIRDLFYLLVIVPFSDIDTSKNWVASTTTLLFRYSSFDSYRVMNITLSNKSAYRAVFMIDADNTYTITPNTGTIESQKSVEISISAYVKATVLPAFLIKSVGDDTISCFENIAISASKQLADCVLDDFKYALEPCHNLQRYVTFHKDINSTCFGGLQEPFPKLVSCNTLTSTLYIPLFVLAGLFFVQFSYTFVLIYLKSKGNIEIVYRTKPFFYIMTQICLFIHLIAFTVSSIPDVNCKVFYHISNFFFAASLSSLNISTWYHHYVHGMRKIVVQSDYLFFFKFFILSMALHSIFEFSSIGEEVVTYTLNINDVTIPISKCGRDIGNTLVANIMPIILCIIGVVNGFTVEHTTVGKEIRWFNRMVLLFLGVIVILLFFEIYNATSDFMTGVALFLLSLLRYVLFIFCSAFWGSYTFIRKGTNHEIVEDNEHILDLFEDPIKRSCLRLHMRELLHEEKIIFYEKLMEFRKNTLHLAHNPSQANNPKIKTIPTKLWGEFEMKQMATEIYDKYIATNEIRLSDSVKKMINAELSKISPTIFDGAILDIRLSISRETSQSFAISSHAKRATFLLKWFSSYEDLSADLKKAVQEKLGIFVSKKQLGLGNQPKNNFLSGPMNLNASSAIINHAIGDTGDRGGSAPLTNKAALPSTPTAFQMADSPLTAATTPTETTPPTTTPPTTTTPIVYPTLAKDPNRALSFNDEFAIVPPNELNKSEEEIKEEPKPTETKAEEQKPTETKAEPKPTETKEKPKPTETKEEPKPTETKEEPKPTETKEEPKPAETKEEPKPAETKEKEPKPTETKEEPKPTETKDPI